ncbi:hypothetical protein VTO42DRAFT_1759 [Malbranchea cinnamomea]
MERSHAATFASDIPTSISLRNPSDSKRGRRSQSPDMGTLVFCSRTPDTPSSHPPWVGRETFPAHTLSSLLDASQSLPRRSSSASPTSPFFFLSFFCFSPDANKAARRAATVGAVPASSIPIGCGVLMPTLSSQNHIHRCAIIRSRLELGVFQGVHSSTTGQRSRPERFLCHSSVAGARSMIDEGKVDVLARCHAWLRRQP